jgi:signal transduction histidine kinase
MNIKSLLAVCAFLAMYCLSFSQSAIVNDDFENRLNKSSDKVKISLLLEKSNKNLNDKEKSIKYAERSLNLARELNDKELRVSTHRNVADIYLKFDDVKKSIEHLQSALMIVEDLNNKSEIARILIKLADTYAESSDYEKALEYSKKALNFNLQTENKKWIGESYHNIGIVYYYLTNYENSLKYNKKAFNLFKELKDTSGIAKSYSNLAMIYTGLDSINLALSYNFKALELLQTMNFEEGIANTNSNIGLAYSYDNNFDEAIKYFLKALDYYEKAGLLRSKIIVLSNLGYSYLSLDNYDKALEYAKTAESLSKDIQSVDIKALVYSLLSDIYTKTEDYKLALEYKDLFSMIKDSIFNKESKEKHAELEIRIETEHENELLKETNKLQTILFITISIFILIILIILYTKFKSKQNTAKLLEEKNSKITEQNTTLEILNNELNEANLAKDKFFSIMAHDLKSPLWWFKNVTDLLANKYDQLSKEKIMEITKVLDDSAQTSLHLIENLLQWSRAQSGKIEFIPENINLNHVFKHIMAHHRLHAEGKNINIEVNIPETATLKADKNMLYSILRNLISNSIKFTLQGGKILINFTEDDYSFIFSIKDDGVGIEKGKIDKLFRIDVQTTSLGTNQEKGTGLGLIITKVFVQKHGGTIEINSEPGQGTEFIVSIPKVLPVY